jgi:hypothetical protein
VLSRIAESLYWIGRYVERAEDTARLLDVHYHLLLEDRRADEASVCRALLDAMGADAELIGTEPDAAAATALLTQDLSFSGSIACSITAAWENARGAREALSSELWETLNTTYREIGSRARAGSGPARHEFFGWVRDPLRAAARRRDDEPRRRVAVPRSGAVSKRRHTARLLRATATRSGAPVGPPPGLLGVRGYLRAYRRSSRTTVEFLLLDRLFRSRSSALKPPSSLAELDPCRAGVDDEARGSRRSPSSSAATSSASWLDTRGT